MSGSGGSGQQFAIRLALEGAEGVKSGLAGVQASAVQAGVAITEAGDRTGRALTVIERGTQVASQGLVKLGGDFASLVPIVDSTGSAVGRMVQALGTGGLLGVLGGVATAVTAAVALWQNWGTVSEALTGRLAGVRGGLEQVTSTTNAYRAATEALTGALNDNATAERNRAASRGQQLSGQVQAGIDETNAELAQVQEQLGALRNRRGVQESLDAYRAVHGPDAVPDGSSTGGRDIRQLLALQQRERSLQVSIQRLRDGRTIALTPDPRADENGPGDVEAAARAHMAAQRREAESRPTRGGGGGGRAAAPANDALRERDALIQRNITAEERYAQGMGRIADLNDRLIAQGNDPLPDEQVQREAVRLMEEYERATQRAGDSTRNLTEDSREFARLATGTAKALSGAFEDLVFEGKNFDDVLKDLERSLLRLGNQFFLQPLFQQGLNSLFGAAGGGGAGGGAGGGGGVGGIVGSIASSLFGGGGGSALATTKGAVDALQAAGTFVTVFHDGGTVGAAGVPSRFVSAEMFADAPRYHSGGIIGPDERPIIAQVGERVLNRKEAADYARGGAVTININGVRDPNEFRQSQSQITASLARAIGRSSRNR